MTWYSLAVLVPIAILGGLLAAYLPFLNGPKQR
jgi:hypothetical protein